MSIKEIIDKVDKHKFLSVTVGEMQQLITHIKDLEAKNKAWQELVEEHMEHIRTLDAELERLKGMKDDNKG